MSQPQDGRELAVVLGTLCLVQGFQPLLLLVTGLVRQGEVQPCGNTADPFVEEPVSLDEMPARRPDGRCGPLGPRLLPGGQFPQPGQPDLDEEVLVDRDNGP
ncbi:hypothetical protein SVIOM74S_05570 [Streptomyces violarus]